MTERAKIEQAIAQLEAQRAILGDEVTQTTLSALRANLAALKPAEKRSLVTVLFADITGFTAIAEKLDAEDVQDMMSQLWARLDQKILAHGGQIDKHIGDRVMAVWGLTEPGEDDPEQAIRAALAMQAELVAFRQTLGIAIPMRTGVNTGLASVAHIASTGERNVIGDTVNLASAMEQAAPSDGILITQATYNQARGLFDMQEQPPLIVKGKTEPVQAYLVLRSRTRSFRMQTRGLAGITTRTIGRQAELTVLRTAYQQVCAGDGLQWLTISGEAGVGKSRLLTDFERWARSLPKEPRFLKARAWPQTTHTHYHLARSLLVFHCQIGDSDPLSIAREKLTAKLTEVLGNNTGKQAAAFIGQLIGFDFSHTRWITDSQQDSRQIQRQAKTLLQLYLGQLTATEPAVMLLEDLQWADEKSLILLSDLLSDQHPWRLTVIGAARPPFWTRAAHWGEFAHHRRLELKALTNGLANELAHELLQKVVHSPAWLVELLVERGGGNPYFTEELVTWLVEQGLIETGSTTWQVHTERPQGLSVPGTIQGVLQTRIEQLDQKERAMLQQAAVVGLAFWGGAVDYIGQEKATPEQWADLQQRDLILPQTTSQLPGEDEYHFKHSLLRDVVYEYALKKERQVFHKRAAEWLSQLAVERVGEWAAVIAAHYEQAQEPSLTAEWYQRAGEQARTIYALEVAIGYFQQALSLLPPFSQEQEQPTNGAARRMKLYQGLGEMFHLEVNFPKAAEAYIGMLAAAAAAGDQVSQTHAWHRAFLSLEDAKAAIALGAEEVEFDNSAAVQQLMPLKLNLLGAIYQVLGSQGRADPYMESTLSLLQEPEYPVGGDAHAAIALYQHSLDIAQKTGNLGGKMLCLTNLGRARVELGEYRAAVADLLQVIQLAERVEWFGISETHRLLAEAYLGEARTADALAPAKQALAWARAVERQVFIGRSWLTLGKVAAQLTIPVAVGSAAHDASACFANSERIFKETGIQVERANALLTWARYELKRGDRRRGEAMRQKANRMLTQLGINRPQV